MQGIADRRPVLEADHAGAQLGEGALEKSQQILAQGFALGVAVGQQHELGESGLRQLLVERQVEARRARADVADVVLEFGACG